MSVLRKKIFRILLILITYSSIPYTTYAQVSKINVYLKKIDSLKSLKSASWGFSLISGKTGKFISQVHPDKSLVPASVLKVVTTATAIALLGDTFRFKTQILRKGEVDGQKLKGSLIVKGFGNPVLGSQKGSEQTIQEVVTLFCNEIKRQNIVTVEGDLVADISYFEQEPVPAFWTWYDIGNYYAPPINALNIGENQYELWFKPGKKAGDSTQFIKTVPSIPKLTIVNHTTTALGGGDQTFIPGPPRSLEKHIYGKMPIGDSFKVKGAIPQPELFFLQLLNDELKKSGIEIKGSLKVSYINMLPQSKVIFTHFSPPLSVLCQYANFTSNNLAAESLLRALGAELKGQGSTSTGIEVVVGFVKSRIGNIDGMKLVDGSGLSKYNLISPSQIAAFLFSISKEQWSKCFINTLPTAGKTGTLERFCEGELTTGKVFAKSGSMERIKCYAGFVKDKEGILNPFAIMVNNHNVSNKEIVKLIENLMELCVQ